MNIPKIFIIATCNLALPLLAHAGNYGGGGLGAQHAQVAAPAPIQAQTANGKASLKRSYSALYSAKAHPYQAYDHTGAELGKALASSGPNEFVLTKSGHVFVNRVDPDATQNGVVTYGLGKNPVAPKVGDAQMEPQAASAYRTVLWSAHSGSWGASALTEKPARLAAMSKFELPNTELDGGLQVFKNVVYINFKTNEAYGSITDGFNRQTWVKIGKPLEFARE